MNMRRGLFRLWVIFAIIFFFAVITLNFDNLKYSKSKFDPTTATIMLPINCASARGELGKNYIDNLEGGFCWYKISEFRKLYPEYSNLSDQALSDELYKPVKIKRNSEPDNHLFWDALRNIVTYGFGIPIIILVLGLSFRWVFKGFKNS